MAEPLFDKLAIIGLGLIGSSIAHAARRASLARRIAGHRADAGDAERARRLGFADRCMDDSSEAVEGRRSRHRLRPGRRLCGAVAKEIAPHLKPGAIVSDVGSVKGAVLRDVAPASAEGRAFHSRPSHRRHRIFRSRSRLCRAVRRALVHPDAAGRHRPDGRGEARHVLAGARQPSRCDGRPTITTWCSPSPAICRI